MAGTLFISNDTHSTELENPFLIEKKKESELISAGERLDKRRNVRR